MKKGMMVGVVAAGAALLVFGAGLAQAELKLPSILGSHMVVQRGQPMAVWGWAATGETVTVTFDRTERKTKANDQGEWSVTLPAPRADGKAHQLTVKGAKDKIELTDILVGDVWIGSGQSNMEWGLGGTDKANEAIAAAHHPHIRLFHVPKAQSNTPNKDMGASWTVCTPASVPGFSAVLYYFGARLEKDVKVPMGLINSSWGGSPIEPWTVSDAGSGAMYNAMIAPLHRFPICGVIWYQGETNVIQNDGLKYFDRMKALIEGWRKKWNLDFAFYFVQLAPHTGYQDGNLPPVWEAQVESLKLPKTGMAVVTDVTGNVGDIHPRNKLDVGNRLALWALAKTYGKKNVVFSGPLYKSMKIEGNKIRLAFAHTGGGLVSRDGKPLNEFQVAGADGKFVPAEATIDGKTVLVQAAGVDAPAQVRFGWHKAANPNLMNKEGLPASPFQTDNWQGGTGE